MPTAARWEEMRNPNDWRRKLPVEAASGLNDWLGVRIEGFELGAEIIKSRDKLR